MPAIGEPAPDFELPDQYGQPTTLASRRGAGAVLLVFFPYAFTPVCTAELDELDRDPLFRSEDVVTWGISCDPVASLKAFAQQRDLALPMLSDFWPHGAVAREYGVFVEARGFAGRGSFLVDRDGILRWSVVTSPDQARDAASYREAIAALG